MSLCGICTDVDNVKHLDLCIVESEGLNVCLECELRLVGYIREMKSLVTKAKMLGIKIGRKGVI